MLILYNLIKVIKKVLDKINFDNGSEYSVTNSLPVQQLPNNNDNWIYYQNLGVRLTISYYFQS